jgi:hypothetical protein
MKNKMLRVLAETITTLALFNCLNIGFSTGVHFKHMNNIDVNNVFIVFSTISAILMMLFLIFVIFLLYTLHNKFFG